jgi:hypothetical protein
MSFSEPSELTRLRTKANAYNASLSATDPRFRRSVIIYHPDGSVFVERNAFRMHEGDHVIVYAEHFPPFVFHSEDVEARTLLETTE